MWKFSMTRNQDCGEIVSFLMSAEEQYSVLKQEDKNLESRTFEPIGCSAIFSQSDAGL